MNPGPAAGEDLANGDVGAPAEHPPKIETQPGTLILVATPIGNLGDISRRAAEELGKADVIACEDTRRTRKLLAHLGLSPPALMVVNEHSEERRAPEVIRMLKEGKRVALVCDAGTPGIADPGERLVEAVSAAGGAVTIVPGPSAAAAAVALSGLSRGRYLYEGFLPRRGSARQKRLKELALSPRAVVLLESPQRCERTARDLAEAFGERRRVAAVRELTKLHEEIFRGRLGELENWAQNARGELVLVIEGAEQSEAADEDILAELASELDNSESTAGLRNAAEAVADRLSVSKGRVYNLARKYPRKPSR